MEEEILIKSEPDQEIKSTILSIMGICFFLCTILFLFFLGSGEYGEYLALLVFSLLFLFLGITALIFFLTYRESQIIITDKNVKGKTLRGNEVILPLYMVSSYGTRKVFSIITVATSSGITKFAFIKNYEEIGNVLSSKINERQENTATTTATVAVKEEPSTNFSIDDLIKLKDLLDKGIITQEEFDAKKKEILGL